MALRSELGEFLRSKRSTLRPDDVGLPVVGRSRVPGLRRDEVALLANMSSNYYERLELATAPHPSAALLTGLANAMRLTADERAYLFSLAEQPQPPTLGGTEIDPSLRRVIDALGATTPALILDDLSNVLLQNHLSVAVFGHLADRTGRETNLLWRWFTDPGWRDPLFGADQQAVLRRKYVARLHAAVARRSKDVPSATLVADLSRASTDFTEVWHQYDVNVPHRTRKLVENRTVGLLDFDCESMLSGTFGQRVMLSWPRDPLTTGRLDVLSRRPAP